MKHTIRAIAPLLILSLMATVSCTRAKPKPTGKKTVAVEFVSPKGSVHRPDSVVASFSSPMVPITSVGKTKKKGPITLVPEVAGSFHWLGTKTVSFVPKEPFPFATTFAASIDPDVTDINGDGLAEAPSWTFETGRPRVTSSKPSEGQTEVELDQNILLTFNQPVKPAMVAEHLKLTATTKDGEQQTLAASARRPTEEEWKDQKTDQDRAVIIDPAKNLPLAASVELTIDDALTGMQGPLAAGTKETIRFTTYAPLEIVKVACTENCDPAREITVELNNRITPKEALKHITIKPEVELKTYAEWKTSWLELFGDFKPNTAYTITLGAGLTDVHGTTLKTAKEFSYATGDYQPSLAMVTGFGVLELDSPPEIAVTTTNVNSLDVKFRPLDPAAIVPLFAKPGLFDPYEPRGDIDWFTTKEIVLPARKNQIATEPLSLADGLGEVATGIILVDVSSPQVYTAYQKKKDVEHFRALIQITDIGITGKFYDGGLLIWTTSLKEGSTLPGVSLEVRNKKNDIIWEGTTDSKGLAKAAIAKEKDADETLYIFASLGDDVAFSTSEWSRGFSSWDFGIWKDWQDTGLKGYLFSERDIYKPGETVHLKAILRRIRDRGIAVPKGLSGTIKATDDRGREYFTKDVTVGDAGSTDADIALPAFIATGRSTIELEVSGDDMKQPQSFRHSITIAAYKPAEFKLTMKPKGENYVAGNTVDVAVEADYLFGEPMKNAAIDWSVFRTRSSFEPEGFDRYTFSTPDLFGEEEHRYYGFMEMKGRTKGTLSDEGKASIAVPTTVGSVPATTDFVVESTVTDINQRTISNRSVITVHPGDFYIGIKTPSFITSAGEPLNAALIAVGLDGTMLPGKKIRGTLYKREWESVKRKDVVGFTYESKPVDKEIGSCEATSKDEPVLCQLTTKSSGMHLIRATSTDGHGNPVTTEAWLFATGAGEAAWEPHSHDRIDLIADKKDYAPGDTAKVLIKSPFEKSLALITYERDGVINQETRVLTGFAPSIDIPLTDRFIPNIYLSVVLVQGRIDTAKPQWGTDEGRPRVKVGYLNIPVSAASKKLAVAVTPDKTRAAPGEEITVALKVTDAGGKPTPCELTVMAVDTGSLVLTGYKTPDAFDTFYAEAGLGVTTTDSRIHVIGRRQYGLKGEPVGGGGGEAGAGRRATFLTVAYWNPRIEVDESGEATVSFKLPDNLTTFRVMAVATTRDRFGNGEAEVISSKPFMMRTSLPFFTAVGDIFKAGIVLHNYTDKELSGTITALAKNIELTGGNKETFSVAPNAHQEIFFSYRAQEEGSAELSFDATADGKSDGLELPLSIKITQPKEVFTTYGETNDEAKELFEKPGDVFADFGGLDVDVSSTALVGLTDASMYLMKYRYECVEQKISKAFGIMTYDAIATALEMDVKDRKKWQATVENTLFELYRAQNWNGGIAFWPGLEPSPYLTVYALHFMTEARAHSYKIDLPVFTRARDYTKALLRWDAAKKGMNKNYLNELKAYAVYILALLGEAEPAYQEKLYEMRDTLSLTARSQLSLAIAMSAGAQSWQDEFLRYVDNHLAVTSAEAHVEEANAEGDALRSNIYADAYVLRALLKLKPQHPFIAKIARYLMNNAKRGYWISTHTTAAVLNTLYTYMTIREGEAPDFTAIVALGSDELMKADFKGRSAKSEIIRLTMERLQKLDATTPLTFTKSGAGTLHYRTRLTYALKTTPLPPLEEGFTILKTIEHYDGKNKGKDFKRGDVVRVRLEFVVPAERRYIVIDDGLPAGLEAIDFSLKTAKQQLRVDQDSTFSINHVETYGDRVMIFADRLPAGSYRFDYVAKAATKGEFTVPPAHIEEMYNPEVFGRTATSTIEIE